MRVTALGKFVFFILAVGIAVGGWRLWQQYAPQPPTGGVSQGEPTNTSSTYSGNASGTTQPPPTENKPSWQTSDQPTQPTTSDGGVEIQFIITAAKKDWVQVQVDRFNEAHKGKWRIVTKPIPSREAMHDILNGKEKPVLWSPGSPIWPTRLAEAWAEKHSDRILDMTDPNAYRVFLRSPLVFLTTKEKAEFLRRVLGEPKPWAALRELSMRKKKAPWGFIRFSHADPLTSSSGMLTLGLILMEYAQQTGQMGALEKVATDSRFIKFLTELEQSLIYDNPAEKGTTALTKAFLEDTSRYDFITAYESAALEAAPKDPNLAVIYPNPTAVAEHAVSLLTASWVTPQQREGALAFLAFLGSKESLLDGMKYRFRPAQSSSALSLASELTQYQSQGFQQSFTSVELPPYQALNAAAYQWRIHVARKPPT
jgi:hypothetical protein